MIGQLEKMKRKMTLPLKSQDYLKIPRKPQKSCHVIESIQGGVSFITTPALLQCIVICSL